MKTYFLSPPAYESLGRLVTNAQWDADFDRCLRFLDVVVEYGEAVMLRENEGATVYEERGWVPLGVVPQA